MTVYAMVYIVFILSIIFFFFFQAEDGIRDWSVTGVQTCALPISRRSGKVGSESTSLLGLQKTTMKGTLPPLFRSRLTRWDSAPPHPPLSLQGRSEERRVGKECRSRWSP